MSLALQPRLEYSAQLDISAQHYPFVLGKNKTNIKDVMQKTGAL